MSSLFSVISSSLGATKGFSLSLAGSFIGGNFSSGLEGATCGSGKEAGSIKFSSGLGEITLKVGDGSAKVV